MWPTRLASARTRGASTTETNGTKSWNKFKQNNRIRRQHSGSEQSASLRLACCLRRRRVRSSLLTKPSSSSWNDWGKLSPSSTRQSLADYISNGLGHSVLLDGFIRACNSLIHRAERSSLATRRTSPSKRSFAGVSLSRPLKAQIAQQHRSQDSFDRSVAMKRARHVWRVEFVRSSRRESGNST